MTATIVPLCATAAAGPVAVRGANGGMALGRRGGGGASNVIKYEISKYEPEAAIRKLRTNKTKCDLRITMVLYLVTNNSTYCQDQYAHFGSRGSPKATLKPRCKARSKIYIYIYIVQEQPPKSQRLLWHQKEIPMQRKYLLFIR